MKEEILGKTETVIIGEHAVVAFDIKFLKLNDGKPIEFFAKINEQGKIVLESQVLTKISNTGSDSVVKR